MAKEEKSNSQMAEFIIAIIGLATALVYNWDKVSSFLGMNETTVRTEQNDVHHTPQKATKR